MKLTVYYDGQFWVGVFEEICNSRLRACRYVFGPEPQDIEVLELVNREMLRLITKSSQFIVAEESVERRISPKRLARLAVAELNKTGVSTKAQQALQLEYEQHKKDQITLTRQQKTERQERKWELKKAKAKEKHRGR